MAEQNALVKSEQNYIIKTLSSTIGALVGFAGIEHGIFETLQGNIGTNGFIIDAIGPAQELWSGAMEPAFSFIPNFLITGICSILIGIFVVFWACIFIQKKHGAVIMLILSILLFLVGGGSPPILLGIISAALATRINKPLTWSRTHLSNKTLAKGWPWLFILFVIVFIFIIIAAITGWPFLIFMDTSSFTNILGPIGYISDLILILAIISGFSREVNKSAS